MSRVPETSVATLTNITQIANRAIGDTTGTLDISSRTNLAATGGITLSGHELSLTNDFGSSIDSNEITNGTIQEIDLEATNAPTDDYYLTFDSATGGFTWVSASAGDTTLTETKVEDFAFNGAFTGNTETGITVSYSTGDNTVDFVVDNLEDLAGTLDLGSGGTGATTARTKVE